MITINIISAHKKRKEYREKNYSGRYRMVEIVNDRPAYKVSRIFENAMLKFDGGTDSLAVRDSHEKYGPYSMAYCMSHNSYGM